MDTRRARILVVDDEQINIQVLEAALRENYDIESALGGHEAIRKVKLRLPDLILLDVMMPDLNGFDVCAIIKADPMFADIPIIFLTAMDNLEGELQGLAAGGIDYLNKPFMIDQIRLRVRNHLELKLRNDLIHEQRDQLARQKEELEATLARVRRLEGIIPICMYCKSIRNDENTWQQLEVYISAHSDAKFSHGICPKCLEKERERLTL